jgi:hypothetical protein
MIEAQAMVFMVAIMTMSTGTIHAWRRSPHMYVRLMMQLKCGAANSQKPYVVMRYHWLASCLWVEYNQRKCLLV